MLFEVIDKFGIAVVGTNSLSCVYPDEVLYSMHKNGYKFKVNGKYIPYKKVYSMASEIFSRTNNNACNNNRTDIDKNSKTKILF